MWGATGVNFGAFFFLSISIHAPRVGCDTMTRCGSRAGLHFNPRTPCGVRRRERQNKRVFAIISIHAPRVGCDVRPTLWSRPTSHFNPRTPCGVRQPLLPNRAKRTIFQSTHPVWGATLCDVLRRPVRDISIHAPRVGCDQIDKRTQQRWYISIHAPRVGCDCRGRYVRRSRNNFNPRTPCGVRPQSQE